jgi:hypothetical protein
LLEKDTQEKLHTFDSESFSHEYPSVVCSPFFHCLFLPTYLPPGDGLPQEGSRKFSGIEGYVEYTITGYSDLYFNKQSTTQPHQIHGPPIFSHSAMGLKNLK